MPRSARPWRSPSSRSASSGSIRRPVAPTPSDRCCCPGWSCSGRWCCGAGGGWSASCARLGGTDAAPSPVRAPARLDPALGPVAGPAARRFGAAAERPGRGFRHPPVGARAMSARHKPVGWTRSKKLYDAVLLAGIAAYLLAYLWLGPQVQRVALPRSKRLSAGVLLAGFPAYLLPYLGPAPQVRRVPLPPDDPPMPMKAYGGCAFLLLPLFLCTGPLAPLARFFLPLLYNRRHF